MTTVARKLDVRCLGGWQLAVSFLHLELRRESKDDCKEGYWGWERGRRGWDYRTVNKTLCSPEGPDKRHFRPVNLDAKEKWLKAKISSVPGRDCPASPAQPGICGQITLRGDCPQKPFPATVSRSTALTFKR